MNRKRTYAGAAAALLLLFSACEMVGPESGADTVPDGKAAVHIGIEGAGIQGRTVFPEVRLGDVTDWKLLGGKSSEPETQLVVFSEITTTVYLETGTWNFTLEGYNSNNALILQGNITGKDITLDGPNNLSFKVAPVSSEGNGTFKITIDLPDGHGITEVRVFKDGTQIDTITPDLNVIVFENTYAAGDYYFSFRLHKGSDLCGVVSELVQVRANLRSEKSYTLGLADLNITYVISYELNGGALGGGVENPGYYRSTDVDFILPIPTLMGYTFGSWYEDDRFYGSTVTEISQSSTGNKTFYAKWTATNYTIDYVLNGGTNDAENPAGYTIESGVINLAPGTRNGYTFTGWYEDNGFTEPPVASIPASSTGDKTFYAKWTAVNYTITYNLDGGTNGATNPATYNIEDTEITLADATRAGYTFEGWYDNAEFNETAVTSIPVGSTGNKTFYAKWTGETYTVTFKSNYPTDTTLHTKTVTVPATTIGAEDFPANPSRTGYTFDGWNTAADGSGTLFTASTTVSGNTTVYAKWTGEIYMVTFMSNYPTDTVLHTKTVTVPATTIGATNFPSNPSRSGYNFDSWNTQADGSGTSFTDSSTVTASITVYAKWASYSYTVNFNKNDGDTEANPATKTVNSPNTTIDSLPTDPTRTGYTFGSWNTLANGLGTPFTEATTVTGDITVYAKWTLNSYDITYHLNGGTNGANPPATYTIESLPITLPTDPSRSGYTFGGWYDNTGFTGTAVTSILAGSTGGKTFYAKWEAITYTVVYNSNDGDGGATASSTHTYGQAKNLTANGFTRTGYNFGGWNTESNGTGTSYANSASVENLTTIDDYTVTFYAQWLPDVSINIWINNDDEILTSNNDVTISKTSANGFSDNFTAEVTGAYTDVEWYVDGQLKTGGTNQSITIDTVVYDQLKSYYLDVIVKKDGVPYSTTIHFTVIN